MRYRAYSHTPRISTLRYCLSTAPADDNVLFTNRARCWTLQDQATQLAGMLDAGQQARPCRRGSARPVIRRRFAHILRHFEQHLQRWGRRRGRRLRPRTDTRPVVGDPLLPAGSTCLRLYGAGLGFTLRRRRRTFLLVHRALVRRRKTGPSGNDRTQVAKTTAPRGSRIRVSDVRDHWSGPTIRRWNGAFRADDEAQGHTHARAMPSGRSKVNLEERCRARY